MSIHNFPSIKENIKRNINEVKSIIADPNILDPLNRKILDRCVYLFRSITKSTIDIGNSIIIENGYRTPLNTADVFISLAEHGVIPPAIIPGMKRAAIIMPRIEKCAEAELIEVMAGGIDDFSRCLSSYEAHFQKKETGGPECK
jgi:hypothetical protein